MVRTSAAATSTTDARRRRAAAALGVALAAGPLLGATAAFEENAGQWRGPVRFVARTRGYAMLLSEGRVDVVVHEPPGCPGGAAHVIGMTFPGSRGGAAPEGGRLAPGRSSYIHGSDPAAWRRDVPRYEEVYYRELYPGVDLRFRFAGDVVEHDFIVAPGADPGAIRFRLDGADDAEITASGELSLATRLGDVVQGAPVVFHDARQALPLCGGYELRAVDGGHEGAFHLEGHDPRRTLVIDPTVVFSTYLGGTNYDTGSASAIDRAGNVYVTGDTYSTDFPVQGGYQTSLQGGYDAVVVKLDPSGTTLIYATYLGGRNSDFGHGIAVDASGNAYVTGYTESTDFPTTAGLFQSAGGGRDGFAAKLDASGSLLAYGTYLGGAGDDRAWGIGVDASGIAYVSGKTTSFDFPTVSPYQGMLRGPSDAFVARIAPSQVLASTYLGGSAYDDGLGLALDASGAPWITGATTSADFPFVGGALPFAGSEDAFATRMDPSLGAVSYSTFFGGTGQDLGYGIAPDGAGGVVIAGATSSADLPTVNPFQMSAGGGAYDGFAARLDGQTILYATYIGGSDRDVGISVAVDGGAALVTGTTWSDDFPTVDPFQASHGGGIDAFVLKLPPTGAPAVYASYLGGSSTEGLVANGGIAARDGVAVVTGYTGSDDFPTVNPLQAGRAGIYDAWIARLDDGTCGLDLLPAALPRTVEQLPYSATLAASGGTPPYTFAVIAGSLPPGIMLSSSGLLSGSATAIGSFAFTVRVASGTSCAGIRPFVIDVDPCGISIAPPSLPLGRVGDAYAQTLVASGGVPPYSFAVSSGTLPPGLVMSVTGAISGVPTEGGSYAFHVRATDSRPCGVTRPYSLEIVGERGFLTSPGHAAPNPPRVRVRDGSGVPTATDFVAYGFIGWSARVASGDVGGDALDEILTGPGPGPGFYPHVRGFHGTGTPLAKVSFFAYGTFQFGADVSGVDLDADGYAEILTGVGPGRVYAPHVRAFDVDGQTLRPMPSVNFLAFPTGWYGVHVAG